MSELLCVTDRSLCAERFDERVRKIAEAGVKAVILREKDLPEAAYAALAREILAVCAESGTMCVLHTHFRVSAALGCGAVHLPLPVLRRMTETERSSFDVLGASCHSAEDAREAESLGCTYLVAGHIFATDCKRGIPPRGTDFLRAVCGAVSLPVYAIGGVTPETFPSVLACGAAGACVMSGLMRCGDPRAYVRAFTGEGKP